MTPTKNYFSVWDVNRLHDLGKIENKIYLDIIKLSTISTHSSMIQTFFSKSLLILSIDKCKQLKAWFHPTTDDESLDLCLLLL